MCMLGDVLNMFAIGTAFLDTRNRRPWNRSPDLRFLEGDPYLHTVLTNVFALGAGAVPPGTYC